MTDTDMKNLDTSNISQTITDYSVDPSSTDGADGLGETTWQMADWETNLGYYKSIPELKTAIDTKARWTVGAGFEAEEPSAMLLGSISGNGKDTFNSILSNSIRTYSLGGDSFAEIITDENDVLVNLKPLDPSSIRVVQNNVGRIIRYEQTNKAKKVLKTYLPHKIFHLSRDRIADEIHGISVIDSVRWIINARNEAMSDWKRVLHRNVDPIWIFHLDTDDTNTIAAFKAKQDSARVNGENLYVPKGAVVPELVATAANASLNPLAWIAQLNDYFFQAVNVPQIIIGNAKEFTDASGKIVYLSYEQSVKSEQLYIEEQVLNQLRVQIKLTFPASLQNELISSREKDSSMQAAAPNDVTAEMEGKK